MRFITLQLIQPHHQNLISNLIFLQKTTLVADIQAHQP